MTVELIGQPSPYPIEIGGAGAGHVFVPLSDLSVGIGDDAQVILSTAYRKTSTGSYVTNGTENDIFVRLRSCTFIAPVFGGDRFTTRNASEQVQRVRMGYVAARHFTDDANRGAWTDFRPQHHGGNVGSFAFSGLDGTTRTFQFRPNTPGDADNCTTNLESMLLSDDPGASAEAGMYWDLLGFVVNDGAVFDLVSLSRFRLRIKKDGDSNCGGGYVEPATGTTDFVLRQARNGVLQQAASNISYDVRGARVQWPSVLLESICAERGLDMDVNSASHGGSWQGEMGAANRAALTDAYWAHPYDDVIDRLDEAFQAGPAWTSGAHWSGGTWRPHLWMVGSAKNDWIQAAFGDTAFLGATYQASIKALMDAILTLVPDVVILAHTSAENDAPGFDSYARFGAGCTAGGATGRGFQNGSTAGAEGATGLYLSLQRDGAAAGLPTSMASPLHWTGTQHAALAAAVKSLTASWLDAALGVVFVDLTSGSDAAAGTFAAPKRTLAGAGTSWGALAVKCGGTTTDDLPIPASGTAGRPKLVFGYGSGAAPIIGGIDTDGNEHVHVFGVDITGGTDGVTVASGAGLRFTRVRSYSHSGHGFAIAGGTVTIELCEGYSNGGQGLDVSGSAAITGRRNKWRLNTGNGVKVAGTATVVEDGAHVIADGSHGVLVSGGTATYRNSKLAVPTSPAANFISATFADGGALVLEHCLGYNGNQNATLISYVVRATGSGRVTWKNCIFAKAVNDLATYVWVDAVGASGNIEAARNTAHEDSGQPFRYAVGPILATATLHTFATWGALTDRTGATLGSGSAQGATGISTTPTQDLALDKPTTSIAEGLGATLAGVPRDYFKRTRPASGAQDAGPFIL